MKFQVVDNLLNEASYTVSVNGNDAFNVINDLGDSEHNQNTVISDVIKIIELLQHNDVIPLKYQKYNISAIQNYVNSQLGNYIGSPNVTISANSITNDKLPLIMARNRKFRRDAHSNLRNYFINNPHNQNNDDDMTTDDYLKLVDGTIHHIDKNESNNKPDNLVLISYVTNGEHNRKIESSINYLFDNYFDLLNWKSASVSLNIPIYYFDNNGEFHHKTFEATIK